MGIGIKSTRLIFNQLPDSFVIKANNGCATVKVVPDKSKINLRALRKELKKMVDSPIWLDACANSLYKNKTLYIG